ncbi:MAG: hypothetical protein LBQ59_05490 [Candidatus Peribacteria bacterium]|nr:hypothetical protein [Candidatus Peribacteria bacterium]
MEFLSELDLKKLEKNENVFFHTDGLCYSEQCHSELDSESLEKIKHPSSKFNLLQYSDDRKIPRNSPLLVPRLPPQLTLTLPLSHTKEEKATSPRMTCSTLKDLKLDYTKNINLFI